MLSRDPVFQESHGRGVAERGMLAPAVVERFDVIEQVGLCRGPRTVAGAPCTRSFFKLLKKLSVGALSQQFPLRLIEQTIPYSFSRA